MRIAGKYRPTQQNEEIEQGESNTHTIEIPDNVVQAKIMVYWADRDASTSANIALVNVALACLAIANVALAS